MVVHCHEARIQDLNAIFQRLNNLDNKLTLGDVLPEPAKSVITEIAKEAKTARRKQQQLPN